jgi:hypothetical protein
MIRSLALTRGLKCLTSFKNASSIFSPMGLVNERHYHRTAVIEFGRKDGNSGFNAKPRDFSKNQKRRWRNKMKVQEEKEKHDPKAKMKSDFMMDQMTSPDTSSFLDETNDRYKQLTH